MAIPHYVTRKQMHVQDGQSARNKTEANTCSESQDSSRDNFFRVLVRRAPLVTVNEHVTTLLSDIQCPPASTKTCNRPGLLEEQTKRNHQFTVCLVFSVNASCALLFSCATICQNTFLRFKSNKSKITFLKEEPNPYRCFLASRFSRSASRSAVLSRVSRSLICADLFDGCEFFEVMSANAQNVLSFGSPWTRNFCAQKIKACDSTAHRHFLKIYSTILATKPSYSSLCASKNSSKSDGSDVNLDMEHNRFKNSRKSTIFVLKIHPRGTPSSS